MKSESALVHAYYDQVTQWFLRMGKTRRAGAIHRSVYLPEYAHLQPDDTVHALIVHALRAHVPMQAVADLGCGVGATMRYVADAYTHTQISGITLSSVQAGFVDVGTVLVASYDALPYADASLDAVWAIESFAHCVDPQRFFAEVVRVLRPGGLCIICDDMLLHATRPALLAVFQHGWVVPNIVSMAVHVDRAARAGLTLHDARNLTDGLRNYALPDVLAQVLLYGMAWFDRHLFVRSLMGSIALQQCYRLGMMQYQFLVFHT